MTRRLHLTDCSYVNDGYYFLDYTKCRESIASVQKSDFEILIDLHGLRAAESKKVSFGMSSVCLSVGTITKNN